MQAGRLRHRITIQHKVVTQGSIGEDVADWSTTSGPFSAEVTALHGRELEQFQQRWAEARFSIYMRFQSGVSIKRQDRAVWGSRTLDILDAEDPDGRRREFRLICRELVQ